MCKACSWWKGYLKTLAACKLLPNLGTCISSFVWSSLGIPHRHSMAAGGPPSFAPCKPKRCILRGTATTDPIRKHCNRGLEKRWLSAEQDHYIGKNIENLCFASLPSRRDQSTSLHSTEFAIQGPSNRRCMPQIRSNLSKENNKQHQSSINRLVAYDDDDYVPSAAKFSVSIPLPERIPWMPLTQCLQFRSREVGQFPHYSRGRQPPQWQNLIGNCVLATRMRDGVF